VTRYLGLDLGTSSLKALVVTGDGEVVARASAAYPTRSDGPGRAEQDPADWLVAVSTVVRALPTVDGVALAGHTPSLVAVDAAGEPVRPAVTWQDVRASAEAAELAAVLGDERPLVGGRLPWNPAYLPAKLLWLARAGLGATRWLLQPKDAVNLALTGVAGTDPWGSKGLCRVDTGAVVAPVFDLAGVSPDLLPPRHDAWARLGAVDDRGAAWSGLPAGTPVAVGWTDALAGMLGIGAFAEPGAFVLAGTSDIAGTTLGGPPAESLLHVPAACAPLPVTYGPTQSSGASVVWLAGLLGRTPGEVVALALEAGGDVPTFVPYLDGERAPVWRPDVRGVLTGLGSTTGAAELARSVLRGVAASDRHVLAEAGHRGEPVHVGGASAQAAGWQRARREVLGADLVVHAEPDTGALGSAMLAAAADTGAPLAEVSARMLGEVTVLPGADDGSYARYRDAAAYALGSA
jgi:xylulokinase